MAGRMGGWRASRLDGWLKPRRGASRRGGRGGKELGPERVRELLAHAPPHVLLRLAVDVRKVVLPVVLARQHPHTERRVLSVAADPRAPSAGRELHLLGVDSLMHLDLDALLLELPKDLPLLEVRHDLQVITTDKLDRSVHFWLMACSKHGRTAKYVLKFGFWYSRVFGVLNSIGRSDA